MNRPTSRLWLLLVELVLIAALCLTVDHCSKTRKPSSNAEAVLYALWQFIIHPKDQTDHYKP